MKKVGFAATLIVLFSAASFAQAVRMRVDVPFQFRAGNQALSAGEYTVTVDPATRRMTIRSVAGREQTSIPVMPRIAGNTPDHSKLLFKRYGNTYFLREVWTAADNWGQEIAPSKAEIEMARAANGTQVAVVPAGHAGGGR